jgi:hypothetical protein
VVFTKLQFARHKNQGSADQRIYDLRSNAELSLRGSGDFQLSLRRSNESTGALLARPGRDVLMSAVPIKTADKTAIKRQTT